jgi:hypothetical protein
VNSSPIHSDTDGDGIIDNIDEAPLTFGLKGGVVGTLMIVSSHNEGITDGHAYLAYTSYVNYDFSVLGTYCYMDQVNDNYLISDVAKIEMNPNGLYTFGLFATSDGLTVLMDSFLGSNNGQASTGTTEGGLYINLEMCKEIAAGGLVYTPRSAIYENITIEQLSLLSNYLSDNDYYSLRIHNCSSLATAAWNQISSRKVSARGDGFLGLFDSPMALKASIEQYDEITNCDYFVEYNRD